jgi:Fic family protein
MEQPHKITAKILEQIQKISHSLGRIQGAGFIKIAPELRKKNKIRTIQSTLSIEGNTLTEQQVTDIIDNKFVAGPKQDILEVKNTIEAYNAISTLNPYSEASFKKAHNGSSINISNFLIKFTLGKSDFPNAL